MVEHRALNAKAAGSNPASPAIPDVGGESTFLLSGLRIRRRRGATQRGDQMTGAGYGDGSGFLLLTAGSVLGFDSPLLDLWTTPRPDLDFFTVDDIYQREGNMIYEGYPCPDCTHKVDALGVCRHCEKSRREVEPPAEKKPSLSTLLRREITRGIHGNDKLKSLLRTVYIMEHELIPALERERDELREKVADTMTTWVEQPDGSPVED